MYYLKKAHAKSGQTRQTDLHESVAQRQHETQNMREKNPKLARLHSTNRQGCKLRNTKGVAMKYISRSLIALLHITLYSNDTQLVAPTQSALSVVLDLLALSSGW